MPEINFSIRIVDEDGDPRKYINVFVHYSDFTHDEESTDDDGWVSFERNTVFNHSVTIDELIVDGDVIDKNISVEDGDTLSFTVGYDGDNDEDNDEDDSDD